MLKRVSIQNFKSLKDVTLNLQKVNLLIGPNNSGKSNFLKALEFCGSIKEMTGSFNWSLLYNKDYENELNIHIVFEDTDISPDGYSHYIISTGEVDNSPDTEYNILLAQEYSDSLVVDEGLLKQNSITTGDGKQMAVAINFLLGNIVIYKPEPSYITLPGPVGLSEEFVNASASNIVGFLDLILGKYRKSTFQKIENYLNECLPEFGEINLKDHPAPKNVDKRLQEKSFKKLGLTSIKSNTTYWADELSEGTLYFLALLCIINQPNPPKLLLLEEPEKGIHPRRIWEIMKFIFQLAEEKDIQIILTTHNEHVVNAFSSIPEAVFVFDKDEESATYVRNLQRDIIEPSHQKSQEKGLDPIDFTSNLGESWLYGLIGGVPADEL